MLSEYFLPRTPNYSQTHNFPAIPFFSRDGKTLLWADSTTIDEDGKSFTWALPLNFFSRSEDRRTAVVLPIGGYGGDSEGATALFMLPPLYRARLPSVRRWRE